MQRAATAHEMRKLAEEAIPVARPVLLDPALRGRESPETVPQEQTTNESAKESPSYLDTRVLEREVMQSRVSKLGVVAVISRFATSWGTRAQWNCFGSICGLARRPVRVMK